MQKDVENLTREFSHKIPLTGLYTQAYRNTMLYSC